MRKTVISNIILRFDSISDIATSIDPDMADTHLQGPKSKSVSDHMWCIVGARESYARALHAGLWVGFTCSLDSIQSLTEIKNKLISSKREAEQAFDQITDWSAQRDELLLGLLEHETTHEGQLIRHLLALEQTIPKSVKWA